MISFRFRISVVKSRVLCISRVFCIVIFVISSRFIFGLGVSRYKSLC